MYFLDGHQPWAGCLGDLVGAERPLARADLEGVSMHRNAVPAVRGGDECREIGFHKGRIRVPLERGSRCCRHPGQSRATN